MKAQQRLAHWLGTKEKDYTEGVQIFIDLNIDVDKIPFLSVKEPDKLRVNILLRQLGNYARIHKIKPQKIIPAVTDSSATGGKKNRDTGTGRSNTQRSGSSRKERVKIDTNPSVKFEDLPANLKVKFTTNGDLSNQNKTIHAELKLIKDDPDKKERRAELANLLVNNTKTIKKNWEEIDAWWNEKQNLSPEEQAVQEALQKQNRIRSNLNYIRRNQGTKKEKQQQQLIIRKKELDSWGVNYEELIKKVSDNRTDTAK